MDLSEEDNLYLPKLNKFSNFKKLNEISLRLDDKKEVEEPYLKVDNNKIKLNNTLFENTLKEKKKVEEKKVETIEDKINNLSKWKDDITFKMKNLENDSKNMEEINNLKIEINKITSILEFLVEKN